MKKLLIATTALVMTAGVAAAEVTVTGETRFGVLYDGENTNFTSRIRVIFGMSGETDGGLSFGASIRADQQEGDENEGGAGSMFISGAFGKLSVGDVAGAAEKAVGDLDGVGLTGLGDFSDTVFITGDGAEATGKNPIFLYEYSINGFSFYLSGNDGRVKGGSLGSDAGKDDSAYAAGIGYEFGDYSIGLGYESFDPEGITGVTAGSRYDHIAVGGSAAFGDVTLKAVYGEASDIDFTQYGISASGTVQAVVVTGYYKHLEVGNADGEAFGIGASYDLGGGAALKGGVVDYNFDAVDTSNASSAWQDLVGFEGESETVADFGINFKF